MHFVIHGNKFFNIDLSNCLILKINLFLEFNLLAFLQLRLVQFLILYVFLVLQNI